jgi:hypothetical protein
MASPDGANSCPAFSNKFENVKGEIREDISDYF